MRNFFKALLIGLSAAMSCSSLPPWWDGEMQRMDRIERGTNELNRLRAGEWR